MICSQRAGLLATTFLHSWAQVRVRRRWAKWSAVPPSFYHPDFDRIGWPG